MCQKSTGSGCLPSELRDPRGPTCLGAHPPSMNAAWPDQIHLYARAVGVRGDENFRSIRSISVVKPSSFGLIPTSGAAWPPDGANIYSRYSSCNWPWIRRYASLVALRFIYCCEVFTNLLSITMFAVVMQIWSSPEMI